MNDVNQQSRNIIDIQEEHTVPDNPTTATAERLSSVFNLTDRLAIFSYLVNSNRIHWYRVIMRFFFQCHRERSSNLSLSQTTSTPPGKALRSAR